MKKKLIFAALLSVMFMVATNLKGFYNTVEAN